MLSLTVKRLGEARRLPASFSSPTYTSSRICPLIAAKRCPSRLTLALSTNTPSQFVIREGLPEGCPLCGSTLISQRFEVSDKGSFNSKIKRPSRSQHIGGRSTACRLGSDNTVLGVPPVRCIVSIVALPPSPTRM